MKNLLVEDMRYIYLRKKVEINLQIEFTFVKIPLQKRSKVKTMPTFFKKKIKMKRNFLNIN